MSDRFEHGLPVTANSLLRLFSLIVLNFGHEWFHIFLLLAFICKVNKEIFACDQVSHIFKNAFFFFFLEWLVYVQPLINNLKYFFQRKYSDFTCFQIYLKFTDFETGKARYSVSQFQQCKEIFFCMFICILSILFISISSVII